MNAKKICPSCKKSLSAAAFNDSARSADGLASTCRACVNARRRPLDRARSERAQPASNAARLAAALRRGDLQGVESFRDKSVKPDWSWVCEAMRFGHLDLAEALLKLGAEQNLFTLAAMADVAKLKRRLHQAPASARLVASMEPASEQVTPLHVGCASDWTSHEPPRTIAQVRVAKILIEHGADVNASAQFRGIPGATPLFAACWSSRNLAMVRWLLEQGAVATENDLRAALGHFQRHGKEAYAIAALLVNWGVPIDGGDRTLLHAFAHQGVKRTVAWLIEHGADVHARIPGGRTAAHLAAERNTGPATLAPLLVEHGADLTSRDDDGQTPLDLARLNEKARLVEWIKKRLRTKSR